MDGWGLLRWLTAERFGAVRWEVVPGTCHERAVLGQVDASAPEYQQFERELYTKALERLGVHASPAPAPERGKKKPEAAKEGGGAR